MKLTLILVFVFSLGVLTPFAEKISQHDETTRGTASNDDPSLTCHDASSNYKKWFDRKSLCQICEITFTEKFLSSLVVKLTGDDSGAPIELAKLRVFWINGYLGLYIEAIFDGLSIQLYLIPSQTRPLSHDSVHSCMQLFQLTLSDFKALSLRDNIVLSRN